MKAFWQWIKSLFSAKQTEQGVSPHEPVTVIPVDAAAGFGAPWVLVDMDLLGKSESDRELAKRLVPEWKLEGYDSSYDSLIGKSRAWCMLRINYVLRKFNLKGAKNAGAKRASEIGKKCAFWFGCILDIAHLDKYGDIEGRHVAIFLYWIDEAKRICATLDGNKGSRFAVNVTDLSGRPNTDTIVAGPRWPDKYPDGQFVSMEEVLKKYPFLKASGKAGGSTT